MTTVPLADAKARLSELVASATATHERTVITRNGKPVAALLSIEDLESLEETLEIMSDPKLMAKIRKGERSAARGELHGEAEVRADLAARRARAAG